MRPPDMHNFSIEIDSLRSDIDYSVLACSTAVLHWTQKILCLFQWSCPVPKGWRRVV